MYEVIAKVHLVGLACHRDFDPPETLVRRTGPICLGILVWGTIYSALGSKSEGMHFSYLGGTVWLRNAR